ncbi:alpha/beta hydrolase [Streptomyces atratus]|uniref:Hydrolase n=1 Tax=Streptomyces atratus TaxID=1893 RepID=A0A8E4HUA9_STRAR|nr:alpha/beta hydrolase [Streptomyces atratus]QLF98915.1 hydrolase [Streptomyces atratus]WPW27225.1 alpha/beta hydrolase [Streptomyces atratus]
MDFPTRQGTFSSGLPHLAFGSGKPLVYLSGFTMTHTVPPPGPQRRRAARLVAPFVAAGYEVFWTNRRPGMPVGTTMGELADEHAEALRTRFSGPVPVLGHGTGGSIALQVAVDHPEAVDRLVLASTAYALGSAGSRFHRDLLAAAERGRSGMHRAAPAITRNPVLQRLLVAPLWLAGRLDPPPPDPSDMKAMLLAEDSFDVRDRLAEVTAPTLVLCGGRDHMCPPEMFDETAAGIPGARLVRYPRRGHNILAAPEFVHDVRAFLDTP